MSNIFIAVQCPLPSTKQLFLTPNTYLLSKAKSISSIPLWNTDQFFARLLIRFPSLHEQLKPFLSYWISSQAATCHKDTGKSSSSSQGSPMAGGFSNFHGFNIGYYTVKLQSSGYKICRDSSKYTNLNLRWGYKALAPASAVRSCNYCTKLKYSTLELCAKLRTTVFNALKEKID